jgi:hypothetical protein
MPIPLLPCRHLNALLTAATLAAAATGAAAAPYATTYTNQVSASTFPEIYAEQPYSVTLVFDNGDSTAASQTWEPSSLTCIIWRMNGNQSVVYAQDLAATPPTTHVGAAHTDASGVLDGFFSELTANSAAQGTYTASGFAPALQGNVQWFINSTNGVFYGNGHSVSSTLGGVSVSPANWSAPAPFTGNCAAPASHPGQPTAVPTLGHAGLALLAGMLGMAGWRLRRRGG